MHSFYGKIGHLSKGLLGVENANKEKKCFKLGEIMMPNVFLYTNLCKRSIHLRTPLQLK